ncbi:hypothetical protein [Aneurinibacillus aneurinilyticus]|nr:hypothetical protein [Aneurinibacillus aneurinilyticus]
MATKEEFVGSLHDMSVKAACIQSVAARARNEHGFPIYIHLI